MTQSDSPVPSPSRNAYPYGQGSSANLADILERVLDKGIVIVGDIKINLLDIELLTIKLRLLVASVDKAKEIGIDWWEHDPALSSRASRDDGRRSLAEQNERLREEVKELRRRVEESPPELSASGSAGSAEGTAEETAVRSAVRPAERSAERKTRAAKPREARRTAEPRRKRRREMSDEDAEEEEEDEDEDEDEEDTEDRS